MIVGLDIINRQMICSECGSIIIGKYHRYDKSDKILCNNCYNKSEKCDICGDPSGLYDDYGKLKICPSCLSKKDVCECCGKVLNKNNRRYIKGISAFFCDQCVSEAVYKCDHCGRPFKNSDILTNINDKNICNHCNKSYIFKNEIANNVLFNLKSIFKAIWDINIECETQLFLSSDIEIKYLKKMKNKKVANESKYGLSIIEDFNNVSIYILEGLELSKFISTLTIEYVTCWMKINQKRGIVYRDISYDFAYWITLKLLSILGYNMQRKLILIEDKNYNKSELIKLIDIEKQKGIDAVIEFILSRNRRLKKIN